MQLFNEYLQYGYYPYYRENPKTFSSKLTAVLDKVLYEDIPSSYNINTESIINLKKLLYLVGASSPFTVDITSIAKNLGATRNSIYQYIEYLDRAGLVISVQKAGGAMKTVRKPAKLYLNNPNLYYTIGDTIDFIAQIGTI